MNALVLPLVAPVGAALLAVIAPALDDSTALVDSVLVDSVMAPATEEDNPRGRRVIIASQDNMPAIVPDTAGLSTPVISLPSTSAMPIIVPPAQPEAGRRAAPESTPCK